MSPGYFDEVIRMVDDQQPTGRMNDGSSRLGRQQNIYPTSTQKKSLSDIAPAWVHGCGACQYGLIHAPEIPAHLSASDARLSQFHAGVLTFCECQAGQAYRAGLMKRADAPSDMVQQQQARMEAAKRRAERLFKDANIPPKFASMTFKGFVNAAGKDPGKQAAIKVVMAYFRKENVKPGIFLCGPTGVGKTGALSPLFLHYMNDGHPGLWLPYMDMMANFRNFDGVNVHDQVYLAQTVTYLFIDDVGDPKKKEATDYEREVVFRVVDHRNNYNLPMFLTSNLPVERLTDYYRPELVKRLQEACEIIPVTGERLR